MKQFVSNFWYLATLLCFAAILCSFVASAGNHRCTEESSNELVEVEECEALREDDERVSSRKDQPQSLCQPTFLSLNGWVRPQILRLSKPTTDRLNHNGIGGYLLT